MSTGNVDTNRAVVGFPHSGTYASALANGDSLVITLPRVARSVSVLTPQELRWVNKSGLAAADIPERSIPTKAALWHERVRQFVEIVIHNDSGGPIAANSIAWDAELTEVPDEDYPDQTAANGFEGFDSDHPNVATETPA